MSSKEAAASFLATVRVPAGQDRVASAKSLVLGYHGCDHSVATKIISERQKSHWLPG